MPGDGRPPMPLELKRRRGRTADTDSGGRKLPTDIVVLPRAEVEPAPIGELGEAGADLWHRIWDAAITWISPHSDMDMVMEACHAADDLAEARQQWRDSLDPKDARILMGMGKRFTEALSVLGFNPVARSRLGVAEVRKASALQQMMERRATRDG